MLPECPCIISIPFFCFLSSSSSSSSCSSFACSSSFSFSCFFSFFCSFSCFFSFSCSFSFSSKRDKARRQRETEPMKESQRERESETETETETETEKERERERQRHTESERNRERGRNTNNLSTLQKKESGSEVLSSCLLQVYQLACRLTSHTYCATPFAHSGVVVNMAFQSCKVLCECPFARTISHIF